MGNKVSVIIPVYNAEDYLERCIDSVLNQTYENLEIIAVNDGSKDGSLQILKKKELQDARIHIIDKENQGVSAARNDGLSNAAGDYILFVDADDYIKPEAIDKILKLRDKESSDCVVFGFEAEGNAADDTDVLRELASSEGAKTPEAILQHVLTIDTQKEILGFTWRYLFSRDLITDERLRFDTSLKISEDYKFIVEYLLHSEKVAVLPEALYVYVLNDNSSTSKYMPTLNRDMVDVNDWIVKNIYPAVPEVQVEHSGCIANAYLNHVQNITKKDSEYGFFAAVKNAYATKREFGYRQHIKSTLKNVHCRKKAQIAFIMFIHELDWLYMLMYYIKKRR